MVSLVRTLLTRIASAVFGKLWARFTGAYDHKREITGKNLSYILSKHYKSTTIRKIAEDHGITPGIGKSENIRRIIKSDRIEMTAKFKIAPKRHPVVQQDNA